MGIPRLVEECDGLLEVGLWGIGCGFEDCGDGEVCEEGEFGEVDVTEWGHDVIGEGRDDVMDVEACEVWGEAPENGGVVDEAEVGADLAVSEIVPVGEGRGIKLLEELSHLGLIWERIVGGQIFEAEAQVEFFEGGKEGVEGSAEGIEVARGARSSMGKQSLEFLGRRRGAMQEAREEGGRSGRGRDEGSIGLGFVDDLGDASGMEDDDLGTDFGGKVCGIEHGLDGAFAWPRLEGGDGEGLGVSFGGAHGGGAEGMDAEDADFVCGDGGADVIGLAMGEGISELEGIETEAVSGLDEGASILAGARVPIGREGKLGFHQGQKCSIIWGRYEHIPYKTGSPRPSTGLAAAGAQRWAGSDDGLFT